MFTAGAVWGHGLDHQHHVTGRYLLATWPEPGMDPAVGLRLAVWSRGHVWVRRRHS